MSYDGPLPQVVNAGGTGASTLTGVLTGNGTSTITANAITNHGVLIGGASNAVSSLGVATSGTVLAGSTGADPSFTSTPTVTSITISNAPSAGTDGTNKTYVDTAIAAVNPATSVFAASTTNIPGTYTNTGGGIGATFLTTSTGAFTVDGTTPSLGARILLKDQSTTFQNGVYTLTTNGTGITGTLFTRALDYDQPSDINSTGPIGVLNGTANMLTSWLINVTVNSVGVDPITYTKFSNAPISYPVSVPNGGTGLATLTAHNVMLGEGTSNVAFAAPSSTSGIPLVSNGASSDPSFTTAVVAGGGTGQTTLTNHGVLVGAGTSAITQLGAGTSGQVLQSGGASADPAYSTATYPATAGASGKVLISDGTNIVSSTPTFPNASASSGKFIRSDGTNWIASTPTLPTTAGSAGTILRSDGTNFVNTTATYPTTAGTSGNVLTSDGTNWNSSAAASSGFSTVNIQTFTSGTTNYTPTANMKYCIIEAVGGGGNGGAGAASGQTGGGGGGGAGGYCRLFASAATIGSSQSVTVGTATNNTTVGSLLTAGGGTTGSNASLSTPGAGGAGGTATGGTVNIPGSAGAPGRTSSAVAASTGGPGGTSFFGGAATGAQGSGASGGNAATNSGSGGGGGAGNAGAAGSGAAGFVVITEFI